MRRARQRAWALRQIKSLRTGRWRWLSLVAGVSPLAAYTVYVTNEKDNTVSIIDSSKLESR